jgi:hypothetical protein
MIICLSLAIIIVKYKPYDHKLFNIRDVISEILFCLCHFFVLILIQKKENEKDINNHENIIIGWVIIISFIIIIFVFLICIIYENY